MNITKKINALIDERLGPIPEGSFWWCPECRAERHPNAVTFEENCFYCGAKVTAKDFYDQKEQHSRKLLAGLIKTVKDIWEHHIECAKAGGLLSIKDQDLFANTMLEGETSLIEQSLKGMKWGDIVKRLEE